MAIAKSFQDLEIWKSGRTLRGKLYAIAKDWPAHERYNLATQIRAAAISLTANIAEGFERGNDREFRHFLRIAKGSAGELRSQLYIATDLEYFDNSLFNSCLESLLSISNLLGGFIEKLSIRIANAEFARISNQQK